MATAAKNGHIKWAALSKLINLLNRIVFDSVLQKLGKILANVIELLFQLTSLMIEHGYEKASCVMDA